MNNTTSRFYGALLTVLIISSVISIKMAYLHAAEIVLFLLISVPAAAAIKLRLKNLDDDNNG